MSTAVFIGNDVCREIEPTMIKEEIEKLVSLGVTVFLNGWQSEFDRLCGKCVFDLKTKYPDIRSFVVVPNRSFNIYNRSLFDAVMYPDGCEKHNLAQAVMERNKYMIDCSDFALCYVNRKTDRAVRLFNYAKKKNLNIVNLRNFDR